MKTTLAMLFKMLSYLKLPLHQIRKFVKKLACCCQSPPEQWLALTSSPSVNLTPHETHYKQSQSSSPKLSYCHHPGKGIAWVVISDVVVASEITHDSGRGLVAVLGMTITLAVDFSISTLVVSEVMVGSGVSNGCRSNVDRSNDKDCGATVECWEQWWWWDQQ